MTHTKHVTLHQIILTVGAVALSYLSQGTCVPPDVLQSEAAFLQPSVPSLVLKPHTPGGSAGGQCRCQ